MPVSVRNTTYSANDADRRGEKVSVRLFGGKIVDRIVWEKCGSIIFLCSERCYKWLLAGEDCPLPVGFPESAVVD